MIGVLALQGGFQSHLNAFRALGVPVKAVRLASELSDCSALVFPGGESTTMSWILKREGLLDAVKQAAKCLPVLATCAGVILLGKGANDPRVSQFELLDVTVERNGYGAQVDSFEADVRLSSGGEIGGIFIRAPKITSCGLDVEILANWENHPVLVRQKNILAATFHPELTDDLTLHQMFLNLMSQGERRSHSQPLELLV